MKFTGELLILILLLITNGRIFFLHRVKRDRIVVFAPICFILSCLLFFAWGFDIFTIAIFILSILVLLSNFHAMFRYSEKLYIDHYSPLMYTWSILTTIIGSVILAGTVYFMPMEKQNQQLGIDEEKYAFTGNFRTEFEQSKLALFPSLTVYKYFPGPDTSHPFLDEIDQTEAENTEPKKVIIFFPDKTADTYHYKPLLQHLAQKGFSVYSGDFFSKDCRWMHSFADSRALRRNVMVFEKILSNQKFIQQKEFYNYNISLECKEMFRILKQLEADADTQFILIGDEMSSTALNDFYNANRLSHPELKGFLLINSLDSYETKGFGCIKQTDPLAANLLGIARDYTFSDVHRMTEDIFSAVNNLTE